MYSDHVNFSHGHCKPGVGHSVIPPQVVLFVNDAALKKVCIKKKKKRAAYNSLKKEKGNP